jgi:phage-related protein
VENNFEVVFLEEALAFYRSLTEKAKAKVIYNLQRAKKIVDVKLFRKLTDHIWEFRTAYLDHQIRLFAFWDPYNKSLVICTHGIFKKTQKTPQKELRKAEKIRIKYLKDNYHETN